MLIKILFFLLIGTVFFTNSKSYSLNIEKYEEIIEETLQFLSSEDIHENKEKIEINYKLIKEKVQSDLKIGKIDTNLNEFLFIHGIFYNDLLSLQSVIMNREISQLDGKLKKHLNLGIIKKLSLAIQENKIAKQTKILVQKNIQCFYYLNGYLVEFDKYFTVPAGVPFYFAIDCPSNMFEIKKVVTSETQIETKIEFKNLQKKHEFPTTMPNPFQAFHDYDDDNLTEDENHIKYSLGLGYLNDFGRLKELGVRSFNLSEGKILLLNTKVTYKNLFVTLNYAPIKLNSEKKYEFTNSYTNEKTEKNAKFTVTGNYFDIGIGYIFQLLEIKDKIALETAFTSQLAILQNEYSSINLYGFGLQFNFGPVIYINEHFFLDIKTGINYFSGEIYGFQIPTNFSVGLKF
ncbi:hypothetical protein QEJ31_10085 [Pigmentibacter sp. JX0631]|uniref:hypothetical protein n=1 Tax=Pigmentibacter sp. JX0631 TaxID=2976982 RepID=UPI002468DA58|nr:hypothetical protein [Pigmentibacter sp. JX0631]WGL58870.1 hypothetical protein QEJ31_10085 [Pigmentibacter sp. JX0631]